MKPPRWSTRLSEPEKRIWARAFSSLLEGHALQLDERAGDAGRLVKEGWVVLNEAGDRIVVAGGVSLIPTPHRVLMDGRPMYVSCAFDAVGIPSALGLGATVNSLCQECGRPMQLELPGDLRKRGPRVWVSEDVVGASFVGDT